MTRQVDYLVHSAFDPSIWVTGRVFNLNRPKLLDFSTAQFVVYCLPSGGVASTWNVICTKATDIGIGTAGRCLDLEMYMHNTHRSIYTVSPIHARLAVSVTTISSCPLQRRISIGITQSLCRCMGLKHCRMFVGWSGALIEVAICHPRIH